MLQHLRVLALVDLPFGLALSHRRCKPRAPSPDRWLSDSALPQAISHDLDGATAADSGHMAVGPKHFEFCEDARGPGAEGCGEKAALCINRYGSYKIMTGGYAVMSHVWGQTMGSNGLKGFGPVDLSLRKRGIYFDHFLKFFMRCNAEWLWVDVIAMPAVLEDMSSSEQEEVEKLRVGVINCLYNIYTRADKVVILDSMVLRLQTGSVVDVGRLRMVDRVHVDLPRSPPCKASSYQNPGQLR